MLLNKVSWTWQDRTHKFKSYKPLVLCKCVFEIFCLCDSAHMCFTDYVCSKSVNSDLPPLQHRLLSLSLSLSLSLILSFNNSVSLSHTHYPLHGVGISKASINWITIQQMGIGFIQRANQIVVLKFLVFKNEIYFMEKTIFLI